MSTENNITRKDTEIVVDRGKGQLSDLWKKEDFMAIWLGFILLIIGLLIFIPRPPADMQKNFEKYHAVMKQEAGRAPFKTIAWQEASAAKKRIRASNEKYAKTIKELFAAPGKWSTNPVDALYQSKSAADALNAKGKEAHAKAKALLAEKLMAAQAAEKATADAGFKDSSLNDNAKAAIADTSVASRPSESTQ